MMLPLDRFWEIVSDVPFCCCCVVWLQNKIGTVQYVPVLSAVRQKGEFAFPRVMR
jgi:hypothetical protein